MNTSTLLTLQDTDEIDYSPICLGTSWKDDSPIEWDFGRASHPGLLILGASGSGKTHALIRLASALKARGLGVHIVDSHGDLNIDGFDFFHFHYNSVFGINPFDVDPHPLFGGPQATVSQVVELLSVEHTSMGPKQRALLESLCKTLFEEHGIYYDRPETWNKKSYDMNDMVSHIENKFLSNQLGLSENSIEIMIKTCTKLNRLSNNLEDTTALLTEERESLEKQFEEASMQWTDVINSAEPKNFNDVLERLRSGFSESALQTFLILFRKLEGKGIFTGQEPAPSSNNVVYSVRGLEYKEQVMLVESILGKIFRYYMKNVKVEDLNQPPHTYIIIDEIKLFSAGAFKSPQHILNRIQTEARKAGLGLILAGQGLEHIPKDVLTNMGTTAVLPVHHLERPVVSRKLQLPAHMLDNIEPRRDGLISMGSKEFEPCKLWA